MRTPVRAGMSQATNGLSVAEATCSKKSAMPACVGRT